MANRLQTLFQALNIPIRFVDINGDGSEYAISVTLTGGGGGGSESIIIADGADVNAGATTDAANTTGTTGTMSGKLRGIVTILADIWDSVANAFRVEGTVASGNPAVGNPLAIGANTYDGIRWIAGDADITPPGSPDGVAIFTRPLSEYGNNYGNKPVSILASAARTTTQVVSGSPFNDVWRGIMLIVDITSAGTGSITPSIQVSAPNSSSFFTIWTAASALTTGGTRAYFLYPGASGGSFTEIAPCGLPSIEWQVTITHNNANSMTYSCGAVLVM